MKRGNKQKLILKNKTIYSSYDIIFKRKSRILTKDEKMNKQLYNLLTHVIFWVYHDEEKEKLKIESIIIINVLLK